MNPTAIVFWLLGGSVGYLFSETVHGTVLGFAICLAASLMSDAVNNYNKPY